MNNKRKMKFIRDHTLARVALFGQGDHFSTRQTQRTRARKASCFVPPTSYARLAISVHASIFQVALLSTLCHVTFRE